LKPLHLAALALGLALLVGVVWFVLEPGSSPTPEWEDPLASGKQGKEAAIENGETENEASGRRETSVDNGTELATTSKPVKAVELGIPAFTGRLLRPDGRPAVQARVQALGFAGRIRGYDAQDLTRRPSSEREVRTNQRGEFAIPESPGDALRWVLRFELAPYPVLELADLGSPPGRTRALGELHLEIGTGLRGVVISEAGLPIVAADIEVYSAADGPKLSRWLETDLFPIPGAVTKTGSDGSFQIDDLPPGSLRVAAHSPGFVRDFSAAAELLAGEQSEPLEIVLATSRPLNGIVLGPDGARLPQIRVEARWTPIGLATVETDQVGRFQLDLPADASEIVLRVSATGWTVLRRRVGNKERDTELELQLAPVGSLFGRVIDADEVPVAGSKVGLFEQSRQRVARVAPWQLEALVETETGSDGSFSLDVDPGLVRDSRFRVVAWTDTHQPATSRSIQFAQRGELAPAALANEIVLQLEAGFQVTGTVSTANGQRTRGARVHLRRDASAKSSKGLSAGLAAASGDIVRAVTTGPDGRFSFVGVSPGDYHLEAMLAGHSPGSGVSFSVVNSHWDEDLRLLHSCGMRGEVRGDRSAFQRLQVIAVTEDGRAFPTLVAPDGFFEISDLPPGLYEVDLYADVGRLASGWGRRQGPHLSEQQEVQVLEGQWTELMIPLTATEFGEIHGAVVFDGLHAADYRVYLIPAGYEGSEAERERQFVVDNMRSTHTDAQGKYRFAGLGELDYWLVLAPPSAADVGGVGGITAKNGPAGLARTQLAAEAGKRIRHDFFVQSARLAGSVVGLRGEKEIALRNGVATAIPASELDGVRRIRTTIDRDGRFVFPPLPAGSWRLDLRSGDFRLRTDAFLLSPGESILRKHRLRELKPKR
jgi:Carboxypeptidase regulatory-like domain